jgi:murein DD-endopeptidase MepM/ murein hydrolase activator NlpD
VQPGTARPGDVVLITVHGAKAPIAGIVGDRSLLFFRSARGFSALIGIPVEQPPGELGLQIQLAEGATRSDAGEIALTIDVVEPAFPSRELQVANRYVNPPPKARRWMAQDQVAFRRAYDQPLTHLLFHRSFAWPRDPLVTAHFGDLRLFNGQKQSQHFGTDLNGRVGEPVSAANDGVVVLSRACYASGNTVVIHHGGGLFTAYFHLSQMQVKPGKKVIRGERIGLVGKTGRVTGPHLHWAAKVNELYVNAESLLNLKFE